MSVFSQPAQPPADRLLFELIDPVRTRIVNAGLSPRTALEYLDEAQRFVSWFGGTECRPAAVRDLTVEVVDRYILARAQAAADRKRSFTAGTKGNIASDLRGFGKYLAQLLGLPANPLQGLVAKRMVNVRGRRDALDHDVVRELFAALDTTRPYDVVTRGILALGLEDGPRTSELVSLDVTDYSVETFAGVELGPVVCLRFGAKGGPERILPLGVVADEFIRAAIGNRTSGPLFPGRDGERMTLRAMRSRVYRAGKRVGLKLVPHRMRRSASSWQQTHGASSGHVDLVFGWEPNPLDVKSRHYTSPSIPQLLYGHQSRFSPLDMAEFRLTRAGKPGLR